MLREDRATSAVPARSTRAARLGAWARESLIARALGFLLGLGVLALIGGSALAGNGAAKSSLSSAAPAPDVSPSVQAIDAGELPVTKPEPPATVAPPVQSATPSVQASTPNVTRATPDDPVELNTARAEDLRRLPGVGEKRAQAILALRARLPGGRFRQIEDLLKVKGVGRAMLKRLHPLVRIA